MFLFTAVVRCPIQTERPRKDDDFAEGGLCFTQMVKELRSELPLHFYCIDRFNGWK
jgi:hypothetical protein